MSVGTNRILNKPPPVKRRKLNNEQMHEMQAGDSNTSQIQLEKSGQEKRQQEENPEQPKRKKPRTSRDIREMMNGESQEETAEEKVEMQEKRQEQENPTNKGIFYGEEREVELINWEVEFERHVRETREAEKERENQIERKTKKEKSWELLRECTKFLRENE